jgi:hypothetical protein
MDYKMLQAIEYITTLRDAQMLLNQAWRERPDERLAKMINSIQSLILEVRKEIPVSRPQSLTSQDD